MLRASLFEAVRSKPERTTQLLSKEDRDVEDARHIRSVLGPTVAAASVLSTVRNGSLVHLPQVPAVLDQSFPDAIVSSIDAIETRGYEFRASLSDRLKFPDTSGAVVLGLVASTQHQPTWRRLPGLLSDRSIAAIARGDSEEAVSAVVSTPVPFLTHGPEFSSAVACVAQSLAGGVAALADLTVLTLGVSGVGTGVGLSPFASDVRSPEQLWKVGAAWGQCLVRLFGLAWSASAADMLIQQLAVECMTGPAAVLVCLPMLEAVASACVLKSGGHRIFAAESVQWDRNQEGVRARLLGVHRGIGQDETVRALRVLGASWSLVKVLLGKTEDNPVQVMAGEDLTNSRLWLLVRAAGCVSACVQGPVLKIGQVSLARLIRFLGLAAVVAMEMWPIVAGPPGHEAQPWSTAVLGSEQVEVAGNHQLTISNLWSAVVAVVKECAERANRASVYTPILSEVVDAVVAVATVAASLRAGYDEHLTFLSEQIVAAHKKFQPIMTGVSGADVLTRAPSQCATTDRALSVSTFGAGAGAGTGTGLGLGLGTDADTAAHVASAVVVTTKLSEKNGAAAAIEKATQDPQSHSAPTVTPVPTRVYERRHPNGGEEEHPVTPFTPMQYQGGSCADTGVVHRAFSGFRRQ